MKPSATQPLLKSSLFLLLGFLPAAAGPLEDTLARMDASARDFKAFSAKVRRIEYTAVLSDSSERTGSVRLKKTKHGVAGIMEFNEPAQSTVRFGGRTVETYYPKANTLEIIDIGKKAGAVEGFLLLGFGTTEAEIRKGWDVKLGVPETIGGVKTTRLELAPKGAETKNLIAKIELWVPDNGANPIQEKVTRPSKDYTFITYSEIKVNAPMPAGSFELSLPAGVKKIYPQK
jgi:outer membrane lipoprotein-sorting protein